MIQFLFQVLVDKKSFIIFTRYDMSKVTQLEIKGAIDVINVTLVSCENKEL
uniref:Uncharacterized protein n=1 Tax=Meloidogyne enterolobii TaxID=390850 RepID=A0A6V7XUF3_MELEN|nr:unnamed protein product [Meloidogyne enterolobii]